MNSNYNQLNQTIHHEADEILDNKGLRAVLERYGTLHASGSYHLDLMVWRDLDLYLETDHLQEADFFVIGKEIVSRLNPVKMHYQDTRIDPKPQLPNGLYWGIYLGNERTGAWKIDIWGIDSAQCQKLLKECDHVKERLTPESRATILEIKSHYWQDPRYRRSIYSVDIYQAVLELGITNLSDFNKWLEELTT